MAVTLSPFWRPGFFQAQDRLPQGSIWAGRCLRGQAVQFTAAQPRETAPGRPDHVHALSSAPRCGLALVTFFLHTRFGTRC